MCDVIENFEFLSKYVIHEEYLTKFQVFMEIFL